MRTLVRSWSLFLLPALAACGLSDVLEPDVAVVDDQTPEIREYEDGVTSVDLGERTLTLSDGTVIQLVDDTEFKSDEYGRAHDLTAAHAALEAEVAVHAWGKGEVTQSDPLMLDALSAGFDIDRTVREFEGPIASVDLEEALFVLEDGTTVWLAEHTERKADQNGDRHELAAVHEAMEAGLSVIARGAGEVGYEDPMVLEALRVGFGIEERRLEAFEGVVTQVHPPYGSFLLEDGTLVRVTDHTEIALNSGLVVTLAAMHVAVEAGIRVVASGVAEVESDEPLVLDALRLVVHFGPDDPGVDPDPGLDEFAGSVDFVDSGVVFLTDGTEVTVSADTEIVAADQQSPASMDELVAALEAGQWVSVSGVGRADPDNPSSIMADRVVFEIAHMEFEQDVASVDWMSSALILEDQTFLLLTEASTVIAADSESPSDLSGVYAALLAGYRVRASGTGLVLGGGVEPGEPVSLEAVSVTLQRLPR